MQCELFMNFVLSKFRMEYRGVGVRVTGNGRRDEDERAGDLLSHQPSLPRLLISYITTPDKGMRKRDRVEITQMMQREPRERCLLYCSSAFDRTAK